MDARQYLAEQIQVNKDMMEDDPETSEVLLKELRYLQRVVDPNSDVVDTEGNTAEGLDENKLNDFIDPSINKNLRLLKTFGNQDRKSSYDDIGIQVYEDTKTNSILSDFSDGAGGGYILFLTEKGKQVLSN